MLGVCREHANPSVTGGILTHNGPVVYGLATQKRALKEQQIGFVQALLSSADWDTAGTAPNRVASTKSRKRSQVEQIRKAGLRAAELTQQLLAFGRKQVGRPRPLNLNSPWMKSSA